MDEFKEIGEEFADKSENRKEFTKPEFSDSIEEEEIIEKIKTINDLFPAFDYVGVVKHALDLLLKKDDDGVNFFMDFFQIEDPQFIVSLNQENLFPFLAETFFGQDNEVLSLNALKVICILIDELTIDSSFFETPEFLEAYLRLFIHPNKEFAIIAATIVYIILNRAAHDTQTEMFHFLFQHGFVTHIFDLMTNLTPNSGDEEQDAIFEKCATCAASFADLLPIYDMDFGLSLDYIGFLFSLQLPYPLRQAFNLLTKLINAGKLKHIEERVLDLAIKEGIEHQELLPCIFSFLDVVSKHELHENLNQYLLNHDFFKNLILSIEYDNPFNIEIIDFLNLFDIYPNVDDEYEHRLFSLIVNANYKERVRLLDRISYFLCERPDQAYQVFMNANVIEIIADLYDSLKFDNDKFTALQIEKKLLFLSIGHDVDLTEVDGIDNLLHVLDDIPDDENELIKQFAREIHEMLIPPEDE